jgi:hypothetical protein
MEPALQTVGLIAVAAAVGIAAVASQCHAAASCLVKGTCRSSGFCSFENSVSVLTDSLYNDAANSYNMSRFEELTRGVCSPGERLHVNSISGTTECAPWRSWPNALNHEIQGSGPSKHQKMCGAWIEAGPTIPTHDEYWSFFDGSSEAAAVRASEATTFSSARLASTDLAKLYASCQHTILGGSGAIRESAVQAYRYLSAGIGNTTTRQQVLSTAGFLAGHSCDGPAQIGVAVGGSSFVATVARGAAFAKSALAESLVAVQASSSLNTNAESANDAINANSTTAAAATLADLEEFFEGGARRTDHTTALFIAESTPELSGLLWLVDQGRFTEAHAYLHGAAAFCAFSILAGMTLDGAGGYSNALRQVHHIRHTKPKAAALARLRKHKHDPMELHVTNQSMAAATTVTFSSLRLDAQPRGNPTSDCVAFTEWLFPDRLDNQYFDAIVTPKLYSRLETMIEQLRTSVQRVVVNDPQISSTLVNPTLVATEVQHTRIRVAGAPRGTWGGIARGYVDAGLSSRDGPMLGALKQSRALFLDRIDMLFDLPSVCSGPPIYDALTASAYIYPGARCIHMMLGILRKPFADERYDDASLATRAVYIAAHELAHNTLVTDFTTQMTTLLKRYPPNVHEEAIADVVAAVAIIYSGLATAKQVCEHISQLWCARVVPGYTTASTAIHPGPNERGDWLCTTLGDLGYLV